MKRPNLALASFYLVANLVTTAVLASFAYILLSLSGFLTPVIAIAFGAILAAYVLLHTAFSVFMARLAGHPAPLPMIGWAAGRLLGAVSGFGLGARIAGTPGALIGAIAFFFLGRFVGGALATRVASLLRPIFRLPPFEPLQLQPPSPARARAIRYFPFSIPATYILTAILVAHFEIRSLPDPHLLTIFRVVLYPAGATLVALPWIALTRPRPANPLLRAIASTPFVSFLAGTAISASPAFLGMILYVAGASALELAIACVIALSASTVWLLRKQDMPSAA